MLIRELDSLQKKMFPQVKGFGVSQLIFSLFKNAIPFFLCISFTLNNLGRVLCCPLWNSGGEMESSSGDMWSALENFSVVYSQARPCFQILLRASKILITLLFYCFKFLTIKYFHHGRRYKE